MKFFAILCLLCVAFASKATIKDCGSASTLLRFQNITVGDVIPGSTTSLVLGKTNFTGTIAAGSTFFYGTLNGSSLGDPVEICLCGECDGQFAFGLGKVHYAGPQCPVAKIWPETIISIKFPLILVPGSYVIEARSVTEDGDEAFCVNFLWTN
ncbi:hypothetical protein WA158_007701 [Blastocystis sp. Blastoise]